MAEAARELDTDTLAPGDADVRGGSGVHDRSGLRDASVTSGAAGAAGTQGDPLRVCVVLPSGTRGGAELWQERIGAASTRSRLDVVALDAGPAVERWRSTGVPTTVVRGGRRTRGAGRSVRDLVHHLRAERPDVVLAHGVKAGLLAAVAGQLAGARVVWVRHDDSFAGPLRTTLDRLTDGRVLTTLHDVDGPLGDGDVLVEPPMPGAPLERAEAQARLDLAPADGRLRLVMGTRLVPYKGMDVAIRAIAQAARWELHVYGIPDTAHPTERQRLQDLARELGVTDRVRVHEPHEDLGRAMAAFDAVAVLTRHEPGSHVRAENFGTTAHEGMRAGVPVVAAPPVSTAAAGASIEVAADDVAEVAAALLRLEDDETRRTLGDTGRELTSGPRLDAGHVAGILERHLAAAARRPGAGLAGGAPITVVTTVLDERDGTVELLGHLVPQLGPDDEIIVVDGGSRDGTADAVRRLSATDPRIRVIVDDGAGISRGRNVGIAAARHELVACTDVGCTPVPGWLDALRLAAADHPDAGLVTGVYSATADSALHEALAAVGYPRVEELRHPSAISRAYGRLFGRSFSPDLPTGRSMAVTRTAWREAGGFPEHLATGEDVTFGMAVARSRPGVITADAEVAWDQRPSLRATLRMYHSYGRGSGLSLDRTLLLRDGLRALAYPVATATLLRGNAAARAVTMAGGAAYLSLPLLRAARGRRPVASALLVPAVAALRDGAKATGAASGLAQTVRTRIAGRRATASAGGGPTQ